MKGYEFTDSKGTFKLEDPDLYSYLYFPDGSPSGMMGSLTPESQPQALPLLPTLENSPPPKTKSPSSAAFSGRKWSVR